MFRSKYILLYIFLHIYCEENMADITSSGYSYTSNPLTLTTGMSFTSKNTSWEKLEGLSNATTISKTTREVETTPGTTLEVKTTSTPVIFRDAECSGLCNNLSASCYVCNTTNDCTYGKYKNFSCNVIDTSPCTGSRTVMREFVCKYCYLTIPGEEYTCEQTNTSCNVAATPRQRVKMNCTVHKNVFCLGKRKFSKMTYCNWTSGYKWSTALILSITLGGFGADRFYLGYWKEGIGKLFSFGGVGVWTLIDIVLIATSYLGPFDGSVYIY
uniref:TM2 domain-containing protein 3-like n=1 Tax=Styela clava TaxID=7725 RepID=UPI0019395A23|nr:TM2 domain-containing protein 3-like [Styela clava]